MNVSHLKSADFSAILEDPHFFEQTYATVGTWSKEGSIESEETYLIGKNFLENLLSEEAERHPPTLASADLRDQTIRSDFRRTFTNTHEGGKENVKPERQVTAIIRVAEESKGGDKKSYIET